MLSSWFYHGVPVTLTERPGCPTVRRSVMLVARIAGTASLCGGRHRRPSDGPVDRLNSAWSGISVRLAAESVFGLERNTHDAQNGREGDCCLLRGCRRALGSAVASGRGSVGFERTAGADGQPVALPT